MEPEVGSPVLPAASSVALPLPTGLAESFLSMLPRGKMDPRREVESGGVGGREPVEDASRSDLNFKLKEGVEVYFVVNMLEDLSGRF